MSNFLPHDTRGNKHHATCLVRASYVRNMLGVGASTLKRWMKAAGITPIQLKLLDAPGMTPRINNPNRHNSSPLLLTQDNAIKLIEFITKEKAKPAHLASLARAIEKREKSIKLCVYAEPEIPNGWRINEDEKPSQ